MAEMDMSHSLSSLPPLGDPPTMDLDLSLTSTYTNTPAGSPLSTTVVCTVLAIFKISLKSTFSFLFISLCSINILYNIKSCSKVSVIECVNSNVCIWGQARHCSRTSLRQWRCLDLTVFPWRLHWKIETVLERFSSVWLLRQEMECICFQLLWYCVENLWKILLFL